VLAGATVLFCIHIRLLQKTALCQLNAVLRVSLDFCMAIIIGTYIWMLINYIKILWYSRAIESDIGEKRMEINR